jgi:hypothetical protein
LESRTDTFRAAVVISAFPCICDNLQRMIARRFGAIAIGGTGLLALASVSVNGGRTLRVVDMNGAPVRPVLAIYHHEGSRPNPVHPVTYQASGRSVIQSDSDGRVQIPMSVHVHWPFPFETAPRLIVDLVYAPPLHNGLATIYGSQVSQPNAFSVESDLATVTLNNCSENPALWEATMRNVSSMIERLLYERSYTQPRQRPRAGTAQLTRRLIEHFSSDYAAFLERYAAVARPTPEMPAVVRLGTDVERQAWQEMIARDLAREPLWGDVAKRLFASDVERFAREP